MAQIGSPVVFTSTEAVRGALGIDQTDIADQSILNAALDVELGLDLYTWCPDYGAKLTVDPDSATPEQLLMKAALTTYAKWFCAAEFARNAAGSPAARTETARQSSAASPTLNGTSWWLTAPARLPITRPWPRNWTRPPLTSREHPTQRSRVVCRPMIR